MEINAVGRAAGGLDRLLSVLLAHDSHQRIRLAMTCFAALLMLCSIAAMHIVRAGGMAESVHVWWWTLFCVSGLVLFYGLVRSGWTSNLRDPSMTLWQVLYAVSCNATAFVIAGSGRGIALPILAVIMMFGIFGLTMGQMFCVLCYALLAYGIAIALVEFWALPGTTPALSAAYGIMVVVVLLSSTFLAARIQAARDRLKRQKHELAIALEQMRELAMHDELTGLLNRRQMAEMIRVEFLRSDRTRRPLVLASLDLDHFKKINDEFGHGAGDRVLKAFAQTLSQCVRGWDAIARCGGEEFLILLTEMSETEALGLLERIRIAVESLEVPGVLPRGRLTVSGGYAQRCEGETWPQMYDRLDLALYRAKSLGRNRMEKAPPYSCASSAAVTKG
ncbi:TPA: GGDEF domain-containing protein [Pseudomonas aeruginosa]